MILKNLWFKTFVTGLASGLLLTLAFPPFDLWYFTWVCFIPVFVFIQTHPNLLKRQILLLTAVFLISSYERIGIGVLNNYSFWYLILMNLYVGLFFWLLFYFYHLLCKKLKSIYYRIVFISFIYVVLEYLKTFWIYFPETITVTQMNNPLILRAASYGGTYLISFLIIFVNTLFSELILSYYQNRSKKEWIKYFVIFILLILFFTVDCLFLSKKLPIFKEKNRIHVLQGNISLREYLMPPEYEKIIRQKYKDLFNQIKEQSDLIIFPEEALTGIDSDTHEYLNWLKEESSRRDADIILSTTTKVKNSYMHYNSMVFITNQGTGVIKYHKRNLIPIREMDFEAGEEEQAEFRSKKIFIAPNLCYESLFPNITLKEVKKGANLIIVSANDTGFVDSMIPEVHMKYTILRAVENGVYAVHASQAGPSAIISPFGDVIVMSELMRKTILTGEIYLQDNQRTFYVRLGWIFHYLVLIYILVYIFLIIKKKNIWSRNY